MEYTKKLTSEEVGKFLPGITDASYKNTIVMMTCFKNLIGVKNEVFSRMLSMSSTAWGNDARHKTDRLRASSLLAFLYRYNFDSEILLGSDFYKPFDPLYAGALILAYSIVGMDHDHLADVELFASGLNRGLHNTELSMALKKAESLKLAYFDDGKLSGLKAEESNECTKWVNKTCEDIVNYIFDFETTGVPYVAAFSRLMDLSISALRYQQKHPQSLSLIALLKTLVMFEIDVRPPHMKNPATHKRTSEFLVVCDETAHILMNLSRADVRILQQFFDAPQICDDVYRKRLLRGSLSEFQKVSRRARLENKVE